jgi:hypothetical protein
MAMQEDDKLQHIVKNKARMYQPTFEESDWQSMQKKIKNDKFWTNLRLIGFSTSAILGLTMLFLLPKDEDKKSENKQKSFVKTTATKIQSKEEIKPKDETKTTIHTTQVTKNAVKLIEPKIQTQIPEVESINPIDLSVQKLEVRQTSVEVETKNALLDKEIRFLAADATGMSDKISKIRTLGKTYENTTYEALDRNISKWKNVVIVCDMTSSMFAYTTQLFDWLNENKENTSIKGIVFFTDCDSLGNQRKGKMPSKMFSVKDRNEDLLWNTMFAAISNSENNKDKPENNLEAALFATKNYKDIDEIVMIADNSASVKDMDLLSKIKKPIHLILCGETFEKNLAFQDDYFKIAKKTKGSIHTVEDDINDLNKIKNKTIIRVGNIYFRYEKGRFKTTKFTTRP